MYKGWKCTCKSERTCKAIVPLINLLFHHYVVATVMTFFPLFVKASWDCEIDSTQVTITNKGPFKAILNFSVHHSRLKNSITGIIQINFTFSLTAFCFLAYFGVSAVLTLMWPYKDLPDGGTLPKVFELRGAPWAKYVIAIGALCGLTSSLLGALVPIPRMLYSMASDGVIFK